MRVPCFKIGGLHTTHSGGAKRVKRFGSAPEKCSKELKEGERKISELKNQLNQTREAIKELQVACDLLAEKVSIDEYPVVCRRHEQRSDSHTVHSGGAKKVKRRPAGKKKCWKDVEAGKRKLAELNIQLKQTGETLKDMEAACDVLRPLVKYNKYPVVCHRHSPRRMKLNSILKSFRPSKWPYSIFWLFVQ